MYFYDVTHATFQRFVSLIYGIESPIYWVCKTFDFRFGMMIPKAESQYVHFENLSFLDYMYTFFWICYFMFGIIIQITISQNDISNIILKKHR